MFFGIFFDEDESKKNNWEEIQLKFSYFHILEVILDGGEQFPII